MTGKLYVDFYFFQIFCVFSGSGHLVFSVAAEMPLAGSVGRKLCILHNRWKTDIHYGAPDNPDSIFRGVLIEKTDKRQKKKRRLYLTTTAAILLAFLVFTKLYTYNGWSIPYFFIPIGISYYTFSVVAYLADIYWRKQKVEKNYFKLALFILYFPKILQGPISEFRNLQPQLSTGHRFDYDSFCFGMQRILWGCFKKLVIADRALILVNNVYGNLDAYFDNGSIIALATLAGCFQLYCDFSGYMDIAIGISQIFGIRLEENFQRPFFSHSAAEFWRRWHITLGAWFRNYVYMPLVVSPNLLKVSKWLRGKAGKRAGKAVMSIIPLTVVWVLTGLWHGTGADYLIWGMYWGTLIIIASVFEPEIKRLVSILHIHTESRAWQCFQVIRTFGVYYASRTIIEAGSLRETLYVWKAFFTPSNTENTISSVILSLGLDKADLMVLICSVGILLLVELWQEYRNVQNKESSLRIVIAKWNPVCRGILFAGALIGVLMFGMYGPGYSVSGFAYMYF